MPRAFAVARKFESLPLQRCRQLDLIALVGDIAEPDERVPQDASLADLLCERASLVEPVLCAVLVVQIVRERAGGYECPGT